MGSLPAVSWLITVKNGMPYLREALASIAAQSFTDYEVLVWLVESEDGTEAELASWIPGRLPGRVFKSGPVGLGAARAELVNRARTEFCACIDADDVNEPNRLEEQVSFLRAHPKIALVGCGLQIIDCEGLPTGSSLDYPLAHNDIVYGFLARNTIGHPGVTFRREAALAAGNYSDDAPVEDYDLWLRLAVRCQLANLPVHLVRYRMHPQSHTRRLEAAGQIDERVARTFLQNASTVFGLTPHAAGDLVKGSTFGTLGHAFTISRHVSQMRREPMLPHLRNPSLMAFLRSRTNPRAVISRLGLASLDRTRGSLIHEMKLIAGRMFRRAPFGASVIAVLSKLRKRWRFRAWRTQQSATGRFIDDRIDFTGRAAGYTHLQTEPGLIIEKDVTIWISAHDGSNPLLSLGAKAFVGRHTYIGVHAPISVGRRVLIGAYSYIISANHRSERRDISISEQGFVGAPITIEDDAWLGAHVIILPGVTIGQGAIIAAGSVVNHNVPAWEVWGGVPARFIKARN